MIAGERQAGKYDLRLLLGSNAIGRQRKADNLVILLGIETALVDADASTARGALRNSIAEALDHIGAPRTFAVLESTRKPPAGVCRSDSSGRSTY